ncbi:unnamed protein product [Cunninghamella blakesleeana]
MYAAKNGHINLVNLLLDLGHEDEVISVDNEGITVLMIAIMYNQEEIFYSYVSKYPECIHAISKNGCSALLVAAQSGNANLVGSLLSISADIDHVDNNGNSALHYATAFGHPTVMELLISEGCNVDLENNDHFTAADFAYSFGIKELLKDLSERIYNTDSAASISSSYKQSFLNTRTYPSSISSNPPLNTTIISRGPSHGTVESPTPRASTSSSSVPFSTSAIPIMNSSNSVASHFYITGTSPSSFHDDHNERARKGSVDSRSPKGRY